MAHLGGLRLLLPLQSLPKAPKPLAFLSSALGCLAFGLADFVESFTRGTFPWWLWAWKIAAGLLLFGLLISDDYSRRGTRALSPWRFVAAALILVVSLVCVVQTHL